SCKSSAKALRQLLVAMWKTLPAADDGFCGTLIEALSDRSSQEKYSTLLRAPTDLALDQMLAHCLPSATPQNRQAISTLLVMAFDGYALNYHLRNGQRALDTDIDTLCGIILSAYPQVTRRAKGK